MSSHPSESSNRAVLEAVLERITYANEETGYPVAHVLTPHSGRELLTVVGNLLGIQPGESLRLEGCWRSHPQYGRQFEVQHYTTVLLATIQGIRRYLGSGLIKGIGPKMAERIVAHFALETLRIIEEESARLIEVPGLGPKRQARITAAWAEQQTIKEVMLFLQGVGVSTSLAVRIYKTYQDGATSVVQHEPYRLAADVWGIGLKTADQIAQRLGIPHDSPAHVKAGLQFTLSAASEEGHCYLPRHALVAQAMDILGVEAPLTEQCLDELVQEGGVIQEAVLPAPAVEPGGPAADDEIPAATRAEGSANGTEQGTQAVYLVPFYRAERSLAHGLRRRLHAPQERLPAFHAVN
jgi:exodeoxyribonuclease V alpha subunit